MGLRYDCARTLGSVSTWGLKNLFHRSAGNFPGKIGLYADPKLIAHLSEKLSEGSVVVVGTNGKTTVTNLLADVLENAGIEITCNRSGANLDSGVATALLHSTNPEWGVFECDELWLSKVLPQLKSKYVVLLNLFDDQLDRVGDASILRDSIVATLEKSPNTVLIYNGDDPRCRLIAESVDNPSRAFGIGENVDSYTFNQDLSYLCPVCSSVLMYDRMHYDHLGSYSCKHCGFSSPELTWSAKNVSVAPDGIKFSIDLEDTEVNINTSASGLYMVYNLLATYAITSLIGVNHEIFQKTVDEFDPQNGRLQKYHIAGHDILLNLAKNPTGFNQNLSLVLSDSAPRAIVFMVNDQEGDGRDVSWIWDVDFEELQRLESVQVYVGGSRRNDLQVRLHYAGFEARLVDSALDALAQIDAKDPSLPVSIIANYTALFPVKDELDAHAEDTSVAKYEIDLQNFNALDEQNECTKISNVGCLKEFKEAKPCSVQTKYGLTVVQILPSLLSQNGSSGNAKIIEQRCVWHDIPVTLIKGSRPQDIDFDKADIVYIGSGAYREQKLACEMLREIRDDLISYIEADGVLLAVGAGFEMIGRTWVCDGEIVDGLDLVGMESRLPSEPAKRIIGDVAVKSILSERPIVGYENHEGRIYLDKGLSAFGTVSSFAGHGNNTENKNEGILYKNVVGTNLHGPLLSKNPEIADSLIDLALNHRARCMEVPRFNLHDINNNIENAANEYMCQRLKVTK